MHIGIAGVGRMGAAIALRLIEVGHQVTVWNRTADKTAPLATAGAKVAASPSALASEAEVILTILTNAEAQSAVYEGPQGILAGKIAGKLAIDMSTVQPAEIVALAAKVRAKGGAFVECPVGGTTGPARQGKLFGFMGAEPEDAARAKPILDQLCRRLEDSRRRRRHVHRRPIDRGLGRGRGTRRPTQGDQRDERNSEDRRSHDVMGRFQACGNTSLNRVPLPGVLCTSTSPSCS